MKTAISVTLDIEIVQVLDNYVEAEGLTRSQVIQKAITLFLKNKKGEK